MADNKLINLELWIDAAEGGSVSKRRCGRFTSAARRANQSDVEQECPALRCKKFRFGRLLETLHESERLVLQEGRLAIVTNADGTRWTLQYRKTDDICRGRRSRVVPTSRR
jgi:hypothetical protein